MNHDLGQYGEYTNMHLAQHVNPSTQIEAMPPTVTPMVDMKKEQVGMLKVRPIRYVDYAKRQSKHQPTYKRTIHETPGNHIGLPRLSMLKPLSNKETCGNECM